MLKGRVVNFRDHGGLCFFDLQTVHDLERCMMSLEETPGYQQLRSDLFVGCCVVAEFKESYNKKQQPIKMLQKVLWSSKKDLFPKMYPRRGLEDLQLKYKDRPLDLVSNRQAFEVLRKRFQIVRDLKQKLHERGFLEVSTPVLQEQYGGALAKPFVTKSQYSKKDYYLRISLEFALKKLIVSGFDRIYQIGPVFRNQDVDYNHTFEFEMLEFYTVDHDYETVVELIEILYRELYFKFNNSYLKDGFDLRNRWPRYTLNQLKQSPEEATKSRKLGPVYHLENCEKIPLGVEPFVCESYVDYTTQLATSYQQQNDVEELLKNCESVKYPIHDQGFIRALRYGMLPTVGCGIGIDRLVKSIVNFRTIREVQPFPVV